MSRRTLVAMLGLVGVALLVVPGLLLLVDGAGSSPTGASSTASPLVSASGGTEAPRAVGDLAWWRRDPTGIGLFDTVEIGTVAHGPTATIELRVREPLAGGAAIASPPHRIVGPSGGRVVLIEEDGAESVLTAVEAATGEATELMRTRTLIIDAAFAGDELVVLTADATSGAPLGAWLVRADGAGDPRPIDGLVGATPDIRLVAIVEWITDLVVSTDGTVAAVLRCEMLDCGLRAVDLATGESWRHALEWGAQPAAILDRLVVLRHACVDVDCRIEVLDLVSGVRRELPRTVDRPVFEVAVIDDPVPAIVTARSGAMVPMEGIPEPVTVEVVDVATMAVRVLPIDLGSLRIVQAGSADAAIELPRGTFLANGGPRQAPGEDPPVVMGFYLVDAASGEAVPVPILGEVFTQG